jgi:V/A-type H+-transporting ATPase subunit A
MVATDRIVWMSADTCCSLEKQYGLLKPLVDFYNKAQQTLREGTLLSDIRTLPMMTSPLPKTRIDIKYDQMPKIDQLDKNTQTQFKSITGVKV